MSNGNNNTPKRKEVNGNVLPTYVVPVRYDLKLTPNLESFKFDGVVRIEFSVDSTLLTEDNAKQITLHAKELCFVSASYVVVTKEEKEEKKEDGGGGGTMKNSESPVTAEQINMNLKATTVTFQFGEAIPSTAKTIVLTVVYNGFLNDQMAGFYRSNYTDITGKTKVMASTQMEALDARRALPCVDEPAAKAVFAVSFCIPSSLTVLSNTPEKHIQSIDATTKEVAFMDTPVMSTYLLAFCVGEFDYVQTQTSHGVMIKVYTPPGKSDSGQFALEVASKALDAFNDFFDIPYPLPKLDMIAIPDFAMGAMENWGLVTYREVDLLIDPVTASSAQKQRVLDVVTHELSHQWFGNLVTMNWWDDLWLNEGFATWAATWASNLIYPEWMIWDQFTTDTMSSAMRLDALKSSHPIQVPIYNAEEVEQVFDSISYCKGGSVVRMVSGVIGMKQFQKGLRAYMQKHKYDNTVTSDLWTALEEASGMPVKELMDSWTNQMGFPLLRVTSETYEANQAIFEVQQSWFLSDGSDPVGEEEINKKWTLPITSCTKEGTQSDIVYMREKTASITVPITDTNASWVKLNAGQEVLTRILYTDSMLQRLEEGIRTKQVPAVDRAGIIDDAYALVKAGHMKPETLLKLLGSYKNEDTLIVWDGLASTLVSLAKVMSDDDAMFQRFKTFAKSLVMPLSQQLGWKPNKETEDGHLSTLLRSLSIGLQSRFCYDDPLVLQEAKSRFDAFQEKLKEGASQSVINEALPSDIRVQVYKIILQNGGQQQYDDVKGLFHTASNNAEKKHTLNSLGSIQDPNLKLAAMEWSTSGEIKIQDFFYVMSSVSSSSREGCEIAWKYLQDNLDSIHNMVANANASIMSAVIASCTGSFCSATKAKEIEMFFEEHPLPKVSRKIEQLVENIRINGKFLDMLQASDLSKEEFWKSL